MTNIRLLAAEIIAEVMGGHSLADCFAETLPSIQNERDRSLLQAICYGVCRFYPRLTTILNLILKKPLKAKDKNVHALLLVGLYQLGFMRIASHAVVDETVKAIAQSDKPWAKNLVNAVLREYLRKQKQLDEKSMADPQSQFAHPEWWIKTVQDAWQNEWEALLLANNEQPPFALRINLQKISREDYCKKISGQTIRFIHGTTSGIILDPPCSVDELPGFHDGEISVQDGAAQLAAPLLNLQPGQNVLDACAAPGGKLTHLLECEPKLYVTAIEKDAKRMASIEENLKRLKFSANCVCQDAGKTTEWWDGIYFDRILLDAPCSASGVMRRHPDIKLLRKPTDIKVLAQQQLHLLNALWPTLAPLGLLLYATCSILPEENEQVLKEFLSSHADAKEEKINADWGLPLEIGRQILPGMHEMDGFYYALIKKMS